MLRFNIAATAEEMSRRAAAVVLQALRQDPNLLLCSSAGGTPTGIYAALAARAAKEPKLFKRMRVILVDEWLGPPPGHPATCKKDVTEKLLRPLNISAKRFVGFDSQASDPEGECSRVANWLARNGPIGVCILGLGKNGHIGMNEPGPAFYPFPHVAKLTPSSLRHPMVQNCPVRPTQGMTLGMQDILSSKRVMLLVAGQHKAAALTKLKEPAATPRFPASALWLHRFAEVYCDAAAAGQA